MFYGENIAHQHCTPRQFQPQKKAKIRKIKNAESLCCKAFQRCTRDENRTRTAAMATGF